MYKHILEICVNSIQLLKQSGIRYYLDLTDTDKKCPVPYYCTPFYAQTWNNPNLVLDTVTVREGENSCVAFEPSNVDNNIDNSNNNN